VTYNANSGSCKVLIVGSEEETWDLTKAHGTDGATFVPGAEGDFSSVEVQLKAS
jgi:hypothetical protein